ncbi:MAG: GNAT family N-acetyltransferase [Planctomycetes bacterium]|nr:GNAT family N-acetyltransferase [Planctomycetota bacterium]
MRKPIAQLRTSRLLLDRVSSDDLDDFVCFYADPLVTATLGGVREPTWVTSYLHRQVEHWERHGFGFWTVRDPAIRQFIGRGGLRHATIAGRTEIEVGYGLMSEFWGRGLATELALESVRVAFEVLDFRQVVSFTLPSNVASRRVMEKAGFEYDCDVVHADLPHVLFRQTRIH